MDQLMEKLEKPKNDYNSEEASSRIIKFQFFKPWELWVPKPFPHRDLHFARGMYMRGEQLTVQTPNFEVFANDIPNITSRNQLIFKVKNMC